MIAELIIGLKQAVAVLNQAVTILRRRVEANEEYSRRRYDSACDRLDKAEAEIAALKRSSISSDIVAKVEGLWEAAGGLLWRTREGHVLRARDLSDTHLDELINGGWAKGERLILLQRERQRRLEDDAWASRQGKASLRVRVCMLEAAMQAPQVRTTTVGDETRFDLSALEVGATERIIESVFGAWAKARDEEAAPRKKRACKGPVERERGQLVPSNPEVPVFCKYVKECDRGHSTQRSGVRTAANIETWPVERQLMLRLLRVEWARIESDGMSRAGKYLLNLIMKLEDAEELCGFKRGAPRHTFDRNDD